MSKKNKSNKEQKAPKRESKGEWSRKAWNWMKRCCEGIKNFFYHLRKLCESFLLIALVLFVIIILFLWGKNFFYQNSINDQSEIKNTITNNIILDTKRNKVNPERVKIITNNIGFNTEKKTKEPKIVSVVISDSSSNTKVKKKLEKQKKPIVLNPVKYIVNSFVVDRGKKSQQNSRKNGKNNVDKPADMSGNMGDILNNTGNVVNHTSNLLTYITIIFAVIGLIFGWGVWKYSARIRKLDQETENLNNKTLDAGLVTLSAVPLAEATQITSDEYNLAIKTITKSIIDNRENIDNNPKYSKLLIVEALHYWNLGNYSHAAEILEEKALKLCYINCDTKTERTIYYHLARIYKQIYYTKNDWSARNKAFKWATQSEESYEKVIKMAICLIDNKKEKEGFFHKLSEESQKEAQNSLPKLRNIIINHFKEYDSNISNIDDIITQYAQGNDKLLGDFASMTAMTTIIIKHKDLGVSLLGSQKNNFRKCQEKLLSLCESEIQNWEGTNVKTSWYKTMYHISWEISDSEKKYKHLFNVYKEKAKNNGVNCLFDCNVLAEEEIRKVEI